MDAEINIENLGGEYLENKDLSKVAFNRENLESLLEVLKKNVNIFSHVEFANWCGKYWSNWRRYSDLYYSTDEETINVVDNVYGYYLENKIEEFEEVKIIEWINMLQK